jgi:hypothetical protein
MAPHDLLVLNTEKSSIYEKALEQFRMEKQEYFDVSGEDIYDDEYGFELGFWKAVRILTGYKAEYDH